MSLPRVKLISTFMSGENIKVRFNKIGALSLSNRWIERLQKVTNGLLFQNQDIIFNFPMTHYMGDILFGIIVPV